MKNWIATILFFIANAVSAITLPTHLQYNYIDAYSPAPDGYYNYDMHLTWHKEPDVSKLGFYAQFAFFFQNGTVGYTGLQQDKDAKKVIFAIWDHGKAQTTAPAYAGCQRFGHEGTGTTCLMPFAWKAGHEYKMRVWRLKDSFNGGSEKWGGWVVDYTTGEETLIGIIEVANTAGLKGYGGLSGTTIGVTEFYGANTAETAAIGCHQLPYFGVTWNGPFANNGSITPDSTSVQYQTGVGTACPGNVRTQANAPFSLTAENGGAVTPVDNAGRNLWDKFKLENYKQVDCIYNWAENNAPGSFNQAQFKHRRLSRSLFGLYYRDYTNNGDGHAVIADMASSRLLLGKPGGVMEDLGSLDSWKQQAGCKR